MALLVLSWFDLALPGLAWLDLTWLGLAFVGSSRWASLEYTSCACPGLVLALYCLAVDVRLLVGWPGGGWMTRWWLDDQLVVGWFRLVSF